MLLGDRTLKINYAIAGTSCAGEVTLAGQKGITVEDKITVDCNFGSVGTFKTTAQICSWEGQVQKSCSDSQGEITIK